MSDALAPDARTVEAAETYRRRKATSVLTIVFTDIAESTLLRERLGELEYERLREPYDATFGEIVHRDDVGSVVKGTGDGALAVFSEPSTAVERCLEVQRTLGDHAIFKLRIGIDMGQVAVKSSFGIVADVFGRHVNRAARIESLAASGHILTSFHVYDCAVGWLRSDNISWHNHGEVSLKGFDQGISIHEVYDPKYLEPQSSERLPRTRRSDAMFSRRPSRTIAVDLPQWEAILAELATNPLKLHETSSLGAEDPLASLSKRIAGAMSTLQPLVPEALSVLWVDDCPGNNEFVLDLLRRSGCRLDLATSTRQAIQLLRGTRYCLIISDMGRGADTTAGLDLLRWQTANGFGTPTFIYSSASAIATFGELARAEGCSLCTAGLVTLLDGVLQVLYGLKSRLPFEFLDR
jgi:class 3 adenylate cyclase/CheY-like chemotaxis protein